MKFMELQNLISDSLSIDELGHYIFVEDQINYIINNSPVDFQQLSKELSIIITKDSFFDKAIHSIKNTVVENIKNTQSVCRATSVTNA